MAKDERAKMIRRANRAIRLLAESRYWAGECHSFYWHAKETLRHGPQRKALIKHIKRVDKFFGA